MSCPAIHRESHQTGQSRSSRIMLCGFNDRSAFCPGSGKDDRRRVKAAFLRAPRVTSSYLAPFTHSIGRRPHFSLLTALLWRETDRSSASSNEFHSFFAVRGSAV